MVRRQSALNSLQRKIMKDIDILEKKKFHYPMINLIKLIVSGLNFSIVEGGVFESQFVHSYCRLYDVHLQEEDPEAAWSRVPRSRSYWQAQEASRRSW